MQQLSLFDAPHIDAYASSRGIRPMYRTITVGAGNTLLFAQHNDHHYFVDTFVDRAQAEGMRDRLNEDAETMVKRKRMRVKRLAPLTREEWDVLEERPKVWSDGKMREMLWSEQWRK